MVPVQVCAVSAFRTREIYCPPQEERLVPMYRKANILGLQNFLRGRFATWASNGRCVEVVWNNFKNIIFESIERFVPHKY
jgi:hypothetical protein